MKKIKNKSVHWQSWRSDIFLVVFCYVLCPFRCSWIYQLRFVCRSQFYIRYCADALVYLVDSAGVSVFVCIRYCVHIVGGCFVLFERMFSFVLYFCYVRILESYVLCTVLVEYLMCVDWMIWSSRYVIANRFSSLFWLDSSERSSRTAKWVNARKTKIRARKTKIRAENENSRVIRACVRSFW